MGSAIFLVQSALYGVLSGDATLQTLLGTTTAAPKVYDAPPENATHPYVVIGDLAEQRTLTMNKRGATITAPLWSFSRYQGAKEITDIVGRLVTLLEDVALTIAGYSHTKTLYTRTVPGRLEAGIVRVGRSDFDLIVWEV